MTATRVQVVSSLLRSSLRVASATAVVVQPRVAMGKFFVEIVSGMLEITEFDDVEDRTLTGRAIAELKEEADIDIHCTSHFYQVAT